MFPTYAVLQAGLDKAPPCRAVDQETNAGSVLGKKEWEAERKGEDLTGKFLERRKITPGREELFVCLFSSHISKAVPKK